MRKGIRRVLLIMVTAVVLQVCFVSAFVLKAHAETVYHNSETSYSVIIEDDANLMNASEKEYLTYMMKPITQYGNVAFKSIDENPYSTSYYIEEYYREQFGKSSGTVFLIDMDNRNIWIFSDGAIYKVITKSYADTITDNCYRYASDGEYYMCAEEAFREIHTLLEGNRIAQPMKYISNTLLAIVLGMMLNFVIVRWMSRVRFPSDKELGKGVDMHYRLKHPRVKYLKTTKTYSPQSSGDGGGGGGSSGGGGGGSSGGGGGHSF